jgi:hypothetical protein
MIPPSQRLDDVWARVVALECWVFGQATVKGEVVDYRLTDRHELNRFSKNMSFYWKMFDAVLSITRGEGLNEGVRQELARVFGAPARGPAVPEGSVVPAE